MEQFLIKSSWDEDEGGEIVAAAVSSSLSHKINRDVER